MKGDAGLILVEYNDIYGREFLSGWEYTISEVDGKRLALVARTPIYPIERSKGNQADLAG
jgi:hypothetical protein